MTDLLLADIVKTRALNQQEARGLVDSIKADITDVGERIATAYLGRSWTALGYADWDAMCDAEFDGARLRVPREQRVGQVQSLRAAGLSTRAIGSALGVNNATVARDLASVANATDEPVAVQSLDGRTRPATQPQRPAAPVTVTHTSTEKTTEQFLADRDTGEVLSSEDWQARERWTPPTPSPKAEAARTLQIRRETWTDGLAKHANFFSRMRDAQPVALQQMCDDFIPERAASYGGVDRQTLRDAAAFLLALADVWKDEAA